MATRASVRIADEGDFTVADDSELLADGGLGQTRHQQPGRGE